MQREVQRVKISDKKGKGENKEKKREREVFNS